MIRKDGKWIRSDGKWVPSYQIKAWIYGVTPAPWEDVFILNSIGVAEFLFTAYGQKGIESPDDLNDPEGFYFDSDTVTHSMIVRVLAELYNVPMASIELTERGIAVSV